MVLLIAAKPRPVTGLLCAQMQLRPGDPARGDSCYCGKCGNM